jgi:Ni,Fe-hydrogenase maturation factor
VTESLLLIAIGNSLRRDDNAGHELAARLEPILRAASIPTERIDLQQLVPETAEDVSHARMVVFLDASTTEKTVVWRRVSSVPVTSPLGHALSPEGILGLAERLFQADALSFLLTIPGKDFSHGEGLNRETLAFLEEAVGMWPHIADTYRFHCGL